MPLTPLDIHNKDFSTSFRGYSQDEVNEFLEQIIRDYEIIIREKKELEDKLKNMAEQMSHYDDIKETLQNSIVVAQEAADELKRNAQQEAKLIVKEAEKNADRIINDALSKARKITIEIDELKKQSKVFRNRFKMLVEAQLDMLNTQDWEQLMEYDVGLTDMQEYLPEEEEQYNPEEQ